MQEGVSSLQRNPCAIRKSLTLSEKMPISCKDINFYGTDIKPDDGFAGLLLILCLQDRTT